MVTKIIIITLEFFLYYTLYIITIQHFLELFYYLFSSIKIISIEKTLQKYGELTASELVDVTHKQNSPWNKTYKNEDVTFSQIELDTIKKYHKYEVI